MAIFRQTSSTKFSIGWKLLVSALGLIAVVATVGFLLFVRSRTLMQAQLKNNLRTMAAISAMHFDGADVEKIRSAKDTESAEYQAMLRALAEIRDRAGNLTSAYIMRKTDDPLVLQFVADADALLSDAERDENGNGSVDEDEVAPLPGDDYDVSEIPVMQDEAFLHPAVDTDITTDQWGSVLSGYAPIMRHDNGQVVAILGLDMDAADYVTLSHSMFSPLLLLLLVLGVGSIAGGTGLFVWQRRMEALRDLDAERSGLLLLASHQLGEPLTIFKWSLEMLRDELESQDLRHIVDGHIVNLESGITRMNETLHVLKRAAEIQEGHMSDAKATVRLDEMLRSIVAQNESRILQNKKSVEVELEPDLRVRGDVQLLRSVFVELLDNAFHYSPAGTVVSIETTHRGRTAVITVRDRGYGISKEDMPHLFEKFFRGTNANHYKANGNGLGLFISKGVIEAHGGKMWAESEEGKGTTVFVRLPMV